MGGTLFVNPRTDPDVRVAMQTSAALLHAKQNHALRRTGKGSNILTRFGTERPVLLLQSAARPTASLRHTHSGCDKYVGTEYGRRMLPRRSVSRRPLIVFLSPLPKVLLG